MQTNPVKAIHEYCLECCLSNINEVKACPAQECPLWMFRNGKNPYRTKRELSEEQIKAASERMKAVNLARLAKNQRLQEENE